MCQRVVVSTVRVVRVAWVIGLQDDGGDHLEGVLAATLSFLHEALFLICLTTQLQEDTELEAGVLLPTCL